MGVYRCKSAAYEAKRDGEARAAGVRCGQLVWGRVERSLGDTRSRKEGSLVLDESTVVVALRNSVKYCFPSQLGAPSLTIDSKPLQGQVHEDTQSELPALGHGQPLSPSVVINLDHQLDRI